jgi:hypothetical protein
MNRHIKKYYFYFVARLLDLLSLYDQSIVYYSKVIQIRTFFWDVQKRHISAYQKSSKNFYLEIHGGVGDFLQFLPFILKNKSANYIVVSHFMDAKNFFKFFGVKISKYYFYNNREEHQAIQLKLKMNHSSYWCPRHIFFDNFPIDLKDKPPLESDLIVGFQIGSSRLTNKPLDKKFALHLIDKLLQLQCKVILFGTQAELAQLEYQPHPYVFLACDKDIIKNLSLVRFCDLLIGGESVFKTMSSMFSIPTLVLHEDNSNRFRDRTFINPYVKKGVMYVYKYKNLSKEFLSAIQFAEEIIKFKLPLAVK